MGIRIEFEVAETPQQAHKLLQRSLTFKKSGQELRAWQNPHQLDEMGQLLADQLVPKRSW
jgi:hypothetical protein